MREVETKYNISREQKKKKEKEREKERRRIESLAQNGLN